MKEGGRPLEQRTVNQGPDHEERECTKSIGQHFLLTKKDQGAEADAKAQKAKTQEKTLFSKG